VAGALLLIGVAIVCTLQARPPRSVPDET
jgi:hypothetical protein